MRNVPDNRSVSHMTIPGTHDACAISSLKFTGCQDISIADQLKLGIRYFDIRAGFGDVYKGPEIVAHHGPVAIRPGMNVVYLPISEVFAAFTNFVTDRFTNHEGLIVQIKQDDKSDPGKFWMEVWKCMRCVIQRMLLVLKYCTDIDVRGFAAMVHVQ